MGKSMNDVNKEPGDKEDLLWFDDKEVYHFFRDGYRAEIPRFSTPAGRIKPYIITPEITRHDERKKRINLMASLLGYRHAQKLCYLHLSLERFLRLAMPINRINLLLNESFFFFERYLYLKLNWDKGESAFYRDHSLHAGNEAFMGHRLLEKIPQIKNGMIDFCHGNNAINRYLIDNCRVGSSNKILEEIIYKTWFISSLFHDIGYVLEFNRKVRRIMLEYNRCSDLILPAPRSNFDHIQMLLGNSLLFNTVKHKEIEESYNRDQHGLLSALLLLSTFYSAPSFDGVNILDRAAIELAARAIYFHDCPEDPDESKIKFSFEREDFRFLNSRYFKKCNDEQTLKSINKLIRKKNGEYSKIQIQEIKKFYKIDLSKFDGKNTGRITFKEDPFSFYLRFIDELQAFGRNRLSFNEEEKEPKEELPFSYSLPTMRNIVQIPAQAVEYKEYNEKDRHLKVYYLADPVLYRGKKKPLYDSSANSFIKSGVKHFLKELSCLKKSIDDSGLFKIDFYWVELYIN